MNTPIPTYQFNILNQEGEQARDVFFLGRQLQQATTLITVPYRRNFYAVGICIKGSAGLKANLETYTITPGCLITKPPYIINQWTYMSDDFESLTVFFTKDFITANNSINPDTFLFFDSWARHVFAISQEQSGQIIDSLTFLKQKYDTGDAYRNDVLRNLINSLLFEIAALYDSRHVAITTRQTRSQLLTAGFKKLVSDYFYTERALAFYAEKLFITPKHLTETVKEVTGKTAGEWITETVVLEARVLLQSPQLTIAQIADMLHFADQSAFGRFFKKSMGVSPVAYKQNLL